MISAHQAKSHPVVHAPAAPDALVAMWLWAVAALVFAMIVVGGATRLTDSGLSITEWQPLLGAIPPLNEADWVIAFEKYRQIPEYHLVNKGMSLDAFKAIYWWEWGHRFLGRFIGIAFALPLAFFWWTGRLRAGLAPKFLAVLGLGALQGVFGWYMVKSGLADRVDVSQYRLALHLTTAFVIFALLIWMALDESARTAPRGHSPDVSWHFAAALVALILVQVVLGAFVAGLKAGTMYNTWPDMNDAFVPPDYWTTTPAYLSFFESHAAVQFNHRLMAYAIGLAALANLALVWRSSDDAHVRRSALAVAAAVALQVVLGIWTLLAAVPLSLGLLHQGGGAIVLAAAVWHLHATARASRVAKI